MLRRHPHVFGSDEERRRGAVEGSWEKIKAGERADGEAGGTSVLDGVAVALPALKRAQKLGKRAASVGFDWEHEDGVREKIAEELAELAEARDAGDQAAVAEELGDLLFAVVNLARHLKVDPEQALADANRKFEGRFRRLESALRERGQSAADLDLDTLEAYWQQAKD